MLTEINEISKNDENLLPLKMWIIDYNTFSNKPTGTYILYNDLLKKIRYMYLLIA